jgi:ankyrin repeat protein
METFPWYNRGYDGHDHHGPLHGTCRWILDRPIFETWLKGPESSLLFITGNSGCGKSFIAKFLRDHLPQMVEPQDLVLSYFCDRATVIENQAPILHYFVHEMIFQRPSLYRHVGVKYSDRNQRSSPLLTTPLLGILENIAKDSQSDMIILVIDGLDECDMEFSMSLLRALDSMLRDDSPGSVRKVNHLRILITCREEKGIETWCPAHSHIRITIDDITPDISRYVDSEVERMAHTKSFHDIEPEVAAALIKTLAAGSFLWTRHVVKDLEALAFTSFETILALILTCPKDMQQYYRQALDGLRNPGDTEGSITEGILILSYFADRPLKFDELQEALSLYFKADISTYDLTGRIRTTGSRLLKLSENGKVEIYHYSLREYLTERYSFSKGHLGLARICLEYLLKPCFANVPSCGLDADNSQESQEALRKMHPFFLYAANNVGEHLRLAGDLVEDLFPLLSEFLRTASANYQTWDYITDRLMGKRRDPLADITPILHILAMWGANNVVDRVYLPQPFGLYGWRQQIAELWTEIHRPHKSRTRLIIPEPWHVASKDGRTMLHHACAGGHSSIVRAFLMHCPRVNSMSTYGVTPLQVAADRGDDESIRLLLAAGADVNVINSYAATALMIAIKNKHESSVRLLLEAGALTNVRTTFGMFPLQIAIEEKCGPIVQLLLKHGANPDEMFTTGELPISYAIANDLNIIFHLLVNRANLELKSVANGVPPLQEAVICESDEYTRQLLTKGVQINVVNDLIDDDHQPWTCLLLAAEHKNVGIVRMLISHGASARIPLPDGETPLHKAAANGMLDICEMIIDTGCDVNATSSDHSTALMEAVLGSHALVVAFLLQCGANPRIQDDHKVGSPLHAATGVGCTSIVKILLNSYSPPSIDSIFGHGQTPIGLASRYGKLDTVEALWLKGANIDIADNEQKTPLQRAVQNTHNQIAVFLLEKGADPAGKDPTWTPLHAAARDGNETVTKALLNHWSGSTVDIPVKHEGTPLYQACLAGHYKVARQLIMAGANPNHICGRLSMLQAAAIGGSIKLVIYLLVLTGNDIDHAVEDNYTLLFCACNHGHLKLVRYLLSRGADAHARLETGNTPLHLVVQSKSKDKIELLELLLSAPYSADINAATNEGSAALHMVCDSIDPAETDVVKLLLDHDADPTAVERGLQFTPFLAACFKGLTGFVQLLLEDERVELTHQDLTNRNCFHLALGLHHKSIVSLIFAKLLGRKDDILKSLLEAKDIFGRSAFDYITSNFPTKADWASGNLPRRSTIHKNIIKHVGQMKQKPRVDSYELLDFAVMGKDLAMIGDDENAIYCYEKSVRWSWSGTDKTLAHEADCDNCGFGATIRGNRYVCRICGDTDLCDKCLELYQKGMCSERLCKGHSFLRIPLPILSASDQQNYTVSQDLDGISTWLDLIEEKYLLGTVSRTGTGLSATFFATDVADFTTTPRGWFGYLRFYTPLSRRPMLLAGPMIEEVLFLPNNEAEIDGYIIIDSATHVDVDTEEDDDVAEMEQGVD